MGKARVGSVILNGSRETFAIVTWPDVVRVLSNDRDRPRSAFSQYREHGFTPDDFAHVRPAREAMTDALSRACDRAELGAPHGREHIAIRDVMRRLEWELWP